MLNITEKDNIIKIIQIPLEERILFLAVIIGAVYAIIAGKIKNPVVVIVTAPAIFIMLCYNVINYDLRPIYVNKNTNIITKGNIIVPFNSIDSINEDNSQVNSYRRTGRISLISKGKTIFLTQSPVFGYSSKENRLIAEKLSEITHTESPEDQELKKNQVKKEYRSDIKQKLKTAMLRVLGIGVIIIIILIIIFNFI